jgi:hypothetical protein
MSDDKYIAFDVHQATTVACVLNPLPSDRAGQTPSFSLGGRFNTTYFRLLHSASD